MQHLKTLPLSILLLALAFVGISPQAHAITADEVKALIQLNFADNNTRNITPAKLRQTTDAMVNYSTSASSVISATTISATAVNVSGTVSASTLLGDGSGIRVTATGTNSASTLAKYFATSVSPCLNSGAACNNSTNDWPALLDAYNRTPSGTGVLRISGPIYIGSNTLTVSKSIGLFFDPQAFIRNDSAGGIGLAAIDITNAADVDVFNATVDGGPLGTRTNTALIHIGNNSKRIRLWNTTANNSSGGGIFVGWADDVKIMGYNVNNTRADCMAVHNENDGAPSNVQVYEGTINNCGDDMISVVGYTAKPGIPTNILVQGFRNISGTAAGLAVVGGTNVQIADGLIQYAKGPYGARFEQDAAYGTYGNSGLQVNNLMVLDSTQTGCLIGASNSNSNFNIMVNGTGQRGCFVGSNAATSTSLNINANLAVFNAGTQGIEVNGIKGLTGLLAATNSGQTGVYMGNNTSQASVDIYAKNSGQISPSTYNNVFFNGLTSSTVSVGSYEDLSVSTVLEMLRITSTSNVDVTAYQGLRNGAFVRPAVDNGAGPVTKVTFPSPNTSRDFYNGNVSFTTVQADVISATVINTSGYAGAGGSLTVYVTNTATPLTLSNILTASGTVLPATMTGAIPNDGSDDYAAIQLPHDQMLSRMLSQTTNVPSGCQMLQSGNYSFSQGLKRYTPICLASQGGAVNLGFQNLVSGSVAVSISSAGFTASNTMLPGQGYAQQGDAISGILGVVNISGSGVLSNTTGVYLGNNLSNTTVTGQDTALTRLDNVRIEGFGQNLWLGGFNTYLNHFYKLNSRTPVDSHVLIQDDTDGTNNNSGENQLFIGSVFSGGVTSQSTPVFRYKSHARNITSLGSSADYIHGNLVQIDDIGAGAMGYSLNQFLDGHLENFDALYAGFAPNIASMQVRVDGNRIFPGAMRSDFVTPNAFDRPWFYTRKTNGWENVLFMNNNIGQAGYDDSRLGGLYTATSGTILIGQCANNTFDRQRQLCHPSLNPFYNSQFENSVVGTDMRWGYTPNLVIGNQTATISLTIVSRTGIPQLAGTNALQMTGLGFFNYSTEYNQVEQGKQFMFQKLVNGQETVTGAFDFTPTIECARPYAWQPLTVSSITKNGTNMTVNTLTSSTALVTNSLVYLTGVTPASATNRPFLLNTDCTNTTACTFRAPVDMVTPTAIAGVTPTLVPAQFQTVNTTAYPVMNISATYGQTTNRGFDGTRNYPIKVGPMDTLSSTINRDITLRYPGCSFLREYGSFDTGATNTSSTLLYGNAANIW